MSRLILLADDNGGFSPYAIVALIVLAIIFLVIFAFAFQFIGLYVQAFSSGARVSFFELSA